MSAAFVEHRPRSTDPQEMTRHYVIIVNGREVGGEFKTQEAAKVYACNAKYDPVHMARVRHLQDRDQPAHWRVDRCS
jgi:hypothetical protein